MSKRIYCIADLIAHAISKNGLCLSTVYKSCDDKYFWRCDDNHEWWAEWYRINKRNSWCGICAGKLKLTNADIDEQLKDRNLVRYDDYVDDTTKIRWKCKAFGHIWPATPSSIKHGNGCPYCYGNAKLNNEYIDQMLTIENRTIIRLSDYINSSTKVTWQCLIDDCKHIWDGLIDNVINGKSGCPKCAGVLKLTNDDIDSRLIGRFIKRLSDFSNTGANDTSASWQCLKDDCKHIWNTSSNLVTNHNTGCPDCSVFKSEKNCRSIFNELFDKNFQKIKPKWLINDSGRKLELDGYNEELLIAFEYNGIQHREISDFFHSSVEKFEKQKRHDAIKIKLCKEYNINLIVVDSPKTDPTEKKILKLILKELHKKENENIIKYLTNDGKKQFNEYLNDIVCFSEDGEVELEGDE